MQVRFVHASKHYLRTQKNKPKVSFNSPPELRDFKFFWAWTIPIVSGASGGFQRGAEKGCQSIVFPDTADHMFCSAAARCRQKLL